MKFNLIMNISVLWRSQWYANFLWNQFFFDNLETYLALFFLYFFVNIDISTEEMYQFSNQIAELFIQRRI